MLLYEDIYNEKFSFGENWKRFLEGLDDHKIERAKDHLLTFMGGKNAIAGKTILDFGSGSGLMSLCFILLGAKKVTSVDVDTNSVECGRYLRKKFSISPDIWEIREGSILNEEFVTSLGKFDVTYSWGVIHHTGNMWQGFENIIKPVPKNGTLYIAIYNDSSVLTEGTSKFWVIAKKLYAENRYLRPFMKIAYIGYFFLGLILHGKNPISYVRNYEKTSMRGMNFFRDMEDWLGGYPYEYASVTELERFFHAKGLFTKNVYQARSLGCNEILLTKK